MAHNRTVLNESQLTHYRKIQQDKSKRIALRTLGHHWEPHPTQSDTWVAKFNMPTHVSLDAFDLGSGRELRTMYVKWASQPYSGRYKIGEGNESSVMYFSIEYASVEEAVSIAELMLPVVAEWGWLGADEE